MFDLFHLGLRQQRGDKNKLYSLHAPHVYCMSKGKEHKRYEFGTTVSISTTRASKIIVGALAFETNPFDGHTLPEVLLHMKHLNQLVPAVGLCDRGYKGKSKCLQLPKMDEAVLMGRKNRVASVQYNPFGGHAG